MRSRWIDRSIWAAFGVSSGVILSALFAAPWLVPLQDRVVNAITNICSAIAAIGGAYFLWQHQIREREARLKSSIVMIFDGLHEDMNLARVTLSYDGSKALLAAQGRHTDDPVEIADYLRYSGSFRLHYVKQRATLALEQLYSIQDAIAGLSREDIEILLELHQIAAEAVRRVPVFVEELEAAPGTLCLSVSSMSIIDHAVSVLAHHLNQLDAGKRDDRLYVFNKPNYEAVKAKAASMAPEVRRLGPAPQDGPVLAESPIQPSSRTAD